MTDNDYTMDELLDAEIVPNQGGSNAWLVRFDEGDYRMVNKTPKNRLLLKTDLLERAERGDTRKVTMFDGLANPEERSVTFSANLEEDRYFITVDGYRMRVPRRLEDDVLEAYVEGDFGELHDIQRELWHSRVRVGLMDQFMPRFAEARADGRLHKTDEGWVVDDTFVVQWNGENYLVDGGAQYDVRGGSTVRADETRQARILVFDSGTGSHEVEAPDGRTFELTAMEVEFLATVECLLNPEEYLIDEEAARIVELRDSYSDPVTGVARTAHVQAFTDDKSGIYHEHEMYKHTLDMLGVTDETMNRLNYNYYDHAGVHELYLRRDEFMNAPFDVFSDADNGDANKWEAIQHTSERAPIPQSVRNEIDSMLG